jgi:rhomboid protease GluP
MLHFEIKLLPMPSLKKEFSFPGFSSEQLLQLSYGTVLQLGWSPKYAGPNALVAFTQRKWNTYDDEVIIETADDTLLVTSSLVHGESFDLLGKNKKHVNEFIKAFENIKIAAPQPEWSAAIEKMRQQTLVTAKEEEKQAEEMDRIMKFSTGNKILTYGIIGINILVFLAMMISGVNFISPSSEDLIKWGANFKPYTLGDDWWRLLTCVFVHIGIIHLLFNMYALYMAGLYLEPMLGKLRFLSAYLCTGIIASIISLWWHKDNMVSAGASGAIFGMYGVFLALLSTNLIPRQIRNSLLQSIGIFIAYNLIYGLRSGVDNAAHVGGLLSGVVAGYIFYLDIGKKINTGRLTTSLLIIVLTIAGTWFFLTGYKDDSVKFNQLLTEYSMQEEEAIKGAQPGTGMTAAEFKFQLENSALPAWQNNKMIIQQMEQLNLSAALKNLQQQLKEYTALRLEETQLLIKAQDMPEGSFENELTEIGQKIEEVLKKINSKE